MIAKTLMLRHPCLLLLLAAAAADAFFFGGGGGGGGGCGCKPACPPPPPCAPPPPPRPCQCGCPKVLPPPPPAPCGCGGAAAASTSYATAPVYATSGNVARDDNITTFAGSYGGSNDSSEKVRPSETKLPELSVPSKYTTYDEFASFLSQANSDELSALDKEPGISASTALRRSAGFRRYERRHREAERRKQRERRRTEASRCPNRRLREMIEEAIWDDGPSAAKYRLLKSARRNLERPFDIICSEGNFSYYIGNDNFCELRTRGVVCLMFEH